MKRFLSIFALLMLAVGICAYAQVKTTYSQRDVRDPRKLAGYLEDLGDDVVAVAADLDTLESEVPAQTDAQATNTVTTAYTPDHIGQILIGKVSTTNAVWVARGATTNDWQQLAP